MSYVIIIFSVIVMWIMTWSGVIPTSEMAWAFTGSFLILDIFGAFRKEKEAINEAINDEYNKLKAEEDDEELSERQKDFQRKMQAFKEPVPDATIRMTDQDGNVSAIIIKSNGEVITEGNPDPEIVRAMQQLQSSIVHFGPEAVAKELAKQIDEMNERESND